MRYPETTWKPHECKPRVHISDIENDTFAAHARLQQVYGEVSSASIGEGYGFVQHGSKNMANEAQHERR